MNMNCIFLENISASDKIEKTRSWAASVMDLVLHLIRYGNPLLRLRPLITGSDGKYTRGHKAA